MTLKDITEQVYSIAVNGTVNGEKFTCKELYTAFKAWLRNPGDRYIFTLLLPDGEWFCEAARGPWGYDYTIPDTREQETRIKNRLFA